MLVTNAMPLPRLHGDFQEGGVDAVRSFVLRIATHSHAPGESALEPATSSPLSIRLLALPFLKNAATLLATLMNMTENPSVEYNGGTNYGQHAHALRVLSQPVEEHV